MSPRFAILGAGIIGLLTARALLARGHRVLLVDQGAPARAASWAGGGIVSPLYPWRYGEAVSVLAAGAQQAYAQLTQELRTETGIDPQYNPCGMLMIAPPDIPAALAWCRRQRRRVIRYAADGLAAVQPGLGAAEEGLWMPEVGNVRNPRLLRALLASIAVHPAARCLWQARVALQAGDADAQLRVNGREEVCDAILVAAGAWSAGLLRPFGVAPAIVPVRGQMILFAPQPGLLRCMVLKDGRYLIPRRDGRILAGSTLEYSGYDATTTAEARATLLAAAIDMLPALRRAEIERQWAGLRPGSPAGIPYIDRLPGTRVFVNAGHYRNGLVLAPAAVAQGVAMLLGEALPFDPTPYALAARRDMLVC